MPRIFGPNATFSSTVRQGNSANDWNTTPRSGPGPFTGRPSSRISPPVCGMKPAIMLRMVVLPQPDGQQQQRPQRRVRPRAETHQYTERNAERDAPERTDGEA